MSKEIKIGIGTHALLGAMNDKAIVVEACSPVKIMTKTVGECNTCYMGTFNYENHFKETKHISYTNINTRKEVACYQTK